MFGPRGWHILPHPDRLPEVLTTVYGRLTDRRGRRMAAATAAVTAVVTVAEMAAAKGGGNPAAPVGSAGQPSEGQGAFGSAITDAGMSRRNNSAHLDRFAKLNNY